MALIEWVPAECDIHIVQGDDWVFDMTVNDTGGSYVWSGATVTCAILRNGSTVVSPTINTAVNGTLGLTLTDTQTAALAGAYEWRIVATKSLITRRWVQGKFTVLT